MPLSNFTSQFDAEIVVRLPPKKDRREEKEFVPPSLFLVAFDDEFKDGTRVLTRYVRV